MAILRTVRTLSEWIPPSLRDLPPNEQAVVVLRPLTARQRMEVLKLWDRSQKTSDDSHAMEAVYLACRAAIADLRGWVDEEGKPVEFTWEQTEVLGSRVRTLTEQALAMFTNDQVAEIGNHVVASNLLPEADRGKS